MTDSQLRLYRREWGAVRKALRSRGITPDQADAERHAIHVRVLGKPKSSTALNNGEFNRILDAFRKISAPPEDLDGQMALERTGIPRLLINVRLLQAAMDKPDAYIVGILRQMNSGGRIGQPAAADRAEGFDYAHTKNGEPARRGLILEDLDLPELVRVQTALKIACRRIWKTKPEILNVIAVFAGTYELDEQVCRDTARAALGWDTLPPLERLKYDHLVLIMGAIRPLATAENPF
jgi:hypothetical protein